MARNSKNVIINTHKYVTHPDDALVDFLNDNKYDNVIHICHSFYDAPDRKSFFNWYKNGNHYKFVESADFRYLPESLLYIKELWFSMWWVIRSSIIWDVYVGMDGLCVLAGNLMKFFGKARKTIYWAIDFVPEKRFDSAWKNFFYHKINIFGYKSSDEMWDLSPRMCEARKKYLGIQKYDYRMIRVVPYGVNVDKIVQYSYEKCDKNTIVFMGHIKESQGAQLIIHALPTLLLNNSKIKLKIIGTGPYLSTLKYLAKELRVENNCVFMGKIDSYANLEDEIAKSCIAVAPYISNLDKWTYYADPGKVKTYLACGVPVILTSLPWNALEIEKMKCGLVIDETKSNLVAEISRLMKSKMNSVYRSNAIEYAKNYDYKQIFSKLHI